MPKIPLYSHQSQPTQSQNVRVNPGMFDQQAQAAQRLGGAVAGIGEVLGDTSFKLQQAQNYRHTAALQTAMDDEWNKFQDSLNPSSDETKWQENWQKTLDARVAQVMPKEAGPLLRQQIELQTQQFKVRTSGAVGHQAKAVGVEKAKVAGLTRTEQLWRSGDAQGAEANLNEMAGLGLITPEEVPGMVRKGVSHMEAQQATNLIATDPVIATDALEEKTDGGHWKNFKNLDEDDRLTLLNHARAQTTALQSANYQELIDGLNNGQAVEPPALQAMVERKLITPKQVKSYTAAYRHGKFNTDPAEIGTLFTDLNNYDPAKDPNNTERAKLLGRIAMSGYPTNVQAEANTLLGKKANPKDPLNGAVARDLFQRAEAEYNKGLFLPWDTAEEKIPGTGWFGTKIGADKQTVMKQLDAEGLKNWMTDLPKATRDAGSVAYATYLSKMRAFFDSKPDATDAEAEAYSQQLKQPYVMAAATQAVKASLAAPQPKIITTQAEFDALQSGESFSFNGRVGVKK